MARDDLNKISACYCRKHIIKQTLGYSTYTRAAIRSPRRLRVLLGRDEGGEVARDRQVQHKQKHRVYQRYGYSDAYHHADYAAQERKGPEYYAKRQEEGKAKDNHSRQKLRLQQHEHQGRRHHYCKYVLQ